MRCAGVMPTLSYAVGVVSCEFVSVFWPAHIVRYEGREVSSNRHGAQYDVAGRLGPFSGAMPGHARSGIHRHAPVRCGRFRLLVTDLGSGARSACPAEILTAFRRWPPLIIRHRACTRCLTHRASRCSLYTVDVVALVERPARPFAGRERPAVMDWRGVSSIAFVEIDGWGSQKPLRKREQL